MTPIEIIALILIALAFIKMVILLVKPKAWMNLTKSIYSNKILIQVVAFILASILLYYLLQELTIVQILAVIAFTAFLVVLGLASEVEFIVKKYEAQIKNGSLWKKHWFYVLVWLVLLIWGAYELFI